MKNRLLEIRLKLGYKFQIEFAEFLGLAQDQYNRYENNERQPGLDVALRISHKLDKDLRDIFYEES